jgi:hypothetical protein
VRRGDGGTCANATGFAVLDPRQKITPVPIATFASAVTDDPPNVRGAIRQNPANGRFEGFNGAFWVPFMTGDPITPGNSQDFAVPGTYQFIVPEGLIALGVDLWSAGGGGGGSGTFDAADECGDVFGGGGAGAGGGGGFIRAVVDVLPGESLEIIVGTGGAPGAISFDGDPGGLSAVVRDSDGLALVEAYGGQGGVRGTQLLTVPEVSLCFDGNPPLAGAGGAGGAPQTPLGLTLDLRIGPTGGSGTGPRCAAGSYPDYVSEFCRAFGGSAAQALTSPTPLTSIWAGQGGRGASPPNTPGGSFPNQPGSPGRVRLFWN